MDFGFQDKMTPRERVIRAIEFSGPDRVPIVHAFLPGALLRHKEKLIELFKKYPSDFGPLEYTVPESKAQPGQEYYYEYTDEWGCLWQERIEGIIGIPKKCPLEDWANLKTYKLPPPPTKEYFENQRQAIKTSKETWYTMGSGGTFFERLQQLRGLENFLEDLVKGSPELEVLTDKLVDYNCYIISKWLDLGVDGISFSDDWGTQTQLWVSPKLWRQFFKPRYKKMFKLVHHHSAHIHLHSDGYIIDIIPDLLEIGVDVLNPQFSCHNIKELSEKFGGKVCINSDLDRQYIFPFGTLEQVKEHVKEAIRLFGNFNGGLIGRGEIGPDVPLENAEAMFQAFLEYGRYPLDWI